MQVQAVLLTSKLKKLTFVAATFLYSSAIQDGKAQ